MDIWIFGGIKFRPRLEEFNPCPAPPRPNPEKFCFCPAPPQAKKVCRVHPCCYGITLSPTMGHNWKHDLARSYENQGCYFFPYFHSLSEKAHICILVHTIFLSIVCYIWAATKWVKWWLLISWTKSFKIALSSLSPSRLITISIVVKCRMTTVFVFALSGDHQACWLPALDGTWNVIVSIWILYIHVIICTTRSASWIARWLDPFFTVAVLQIIITVIRMSALCENTYSMNQTVYIRQRNYSD